MNKRRYFYSIPVILLLITIIVGWFATDYLGDNARKEVIGESQASALTLSIYVSSTLNYIEGAVKSLSGSPWIAPALLSKRDLDIEHANSALDRYNSALNASVSYVMDAEGMTVASSNRKDPDSFVGKSYRFRPYFQEAAKGQPDRYFALGVTSGKRGFYASYPVQNRSGNVVGVVTMKKDLDDMETFFNKYPLCFLINPDGIIFLSSKPAMVLKSLWPLDKTAQEKLIASRQFNNKPFEAVMKKEVADGTEVTLEGKDYFVSRAVIDSDGWSIVFMAPTDHVRSYKLIGILATFGACSLIMFFSGIIYVTDRSREAIRQSGELYKALAEKSIAGVYVVQDGKFRFINSNAASYACYTREELLNQDANILVNPEDREQVRQNARAMLLGEMSSPYEFRIITKQGETRWIMETVTSILHEGRPAILGNSMNITERKRIEEELQENRSRLADIVTFLPDATLAIDKEKRIIIWNKAIEEMTGIPAAEMIGKGDYAIPFYGEARPQLMDLVFLDHKEIAAQYPNITREGDSITAQAFCNALYNNKGAWVFAKASPLHDQSGNIIGVIESIRDITAQKQAEEALKENESRIRAITDSAQDAILMMDSEGCVSYWNPAAERILGYTSAEAIGQNMHTLIAPSRYHEAHHAALPVFQQKGQGGAVGKTLDLEAIRKDGKEISVQLSLSAIQMKGTWHAVGVLRDITERKRMAEALEKRESVLNEVGAIAKVGGWEFDAESQKQVWTKEVYRIHEVDESYEPTVSKGIEFYTPASGPVIESAVQRAIEYGEPFDVELEIITAKGNHRWVHANGNVRQENGITKIVYGTFQDITERKQTDAKIRQMAYHDSLTGLPNRKLFSDRLGIALAQAQRNQKGVAVTMLDLDNFKTVNDTLGHDVGDLLLKAAAERLSAALRKGDTVARFGGDEFVLILPDLKGIEDVIQVAQKIVDSFRQPFLIDTHQLIVTTSIGIAVYPHDGTDGDSLLKNADIAMYQVKQTGRNRYQLCKKA
jgi:diguanylate cyclase (GGDEF)-like protein/PAS domain S-box-containing protein